MKITKLEVKGFKSFPDKTVFEFKPGITAIVGPNGCGKSNVFESMRWAMGEQRIRSLRGKKMEDVIFNGSESRKPVGMAEVRLVLSNTEGLAPASMADYDEIMITRRLFRDGESQYEINNVPCRLSDVTDFFLDTGVGRNSYAIIEQGRVDMVVASKPEDRRVLIEEAAGINRYKSRREAALKKLEQTSQNLLRINDVIGEVKRQSAALKRQASKAQRYRELSERLHELDVALHAYKCHELQGQIGQVGGELEKSRSALLENESQYSTLTARLEDDRLKALQRERALKDLLEARHQVELELTGLRGGIERDRNRVSQLANQQQRCVGEKQVLEEKVEEAKGLQEALDRDKGAVNVELKAAQDQLKQALGEAEGSERDLVRQRKHLDQLKDDIFHTLQETSQERNRRETLTRRGTEIASHLERISRDYGAIRTGLEAQKRQKDRLTDDIAEIARNRQQNSAKKGELLKARESARQRISSLRDSLKVTEKDLASAQARLESIEEMQKNYRGYGEGVRFLLKDEGSAKKDALLGPLAEMIDVPREYQKALTGALGDRLGHLVVTSTREGAKAADRLKEAGAGRSTFIPLSPRPVPESELGALPEGLTPLQQVVCFREGCESLGDFLLNRCFVVEDMQQAVEIWENNGIHVDLVTAGGEMLNRHGEISGGSQEDGRDTVFEQRREIAALQEKVALVEQELTVLQSALNDEEAHLERLSLESDQVERLLNELNVNEVHLRKDQEVLAAQVSNAERKLEVLNLERERLANEQAGLSIDLAQAEESISLLEQKRVAIEKEREEVNHKVEELSLFTLKKSQQTSLLQVRAAQLEERSHSLERECRTSLESLKQHETRLAALAAEIVHNQAEEKKLGDQITQAEQREKELMEQHEAQAGQIGILRTESADLSTSVEKLEREGAATAKAVKELKEIVHSLEIESVRLEQALQGVIEKILERYHVDPRSVACPDSPPDDAVIIEIRNKMDLMGEVNLAAISESQQAEERLTFLLDQQEDLKKAVDSLYATINTINKTTRERFRTAFDNVNEKFQEIFPFLFRGGEARLELTDEEDLLETGVDIMARPPGKRIQNMDLLSGGEKALTAVALIFSIFLIRPSPFCLLDEVDAPLDDANLARFNEMLRKLSNRTQFLVITHNKRSMEEADSLYGITMEEPGVSGVVSVEFVK
ncbi:MAG: chromosome segregation protein SMC [Desulfomonilaceae bacterium]